MVAGADLVEQVVESDDILELYDKAREFSELIDEAQADFLHQEMDIGLMNKHKRKRMEKNHKRMVSAREGGEKGLGGSDEKGLGKSRWKRPSMTD